MQPVLLSLAVAKLTVPAADEPFPVWVNISRPSSTAVSVKLQLDSSDAATVRAVNGSVKCSCVWGVREGCGRWVSSNHGEIQGVTCGKCVFMEFIRFECRIHVVLRESQLRG